MIRWLLRAALSLTLACGARPAGAPVAVDSRSDPLALGNAGSGSMPSSAPPRRVEEPWRLRELRRSMARVERVRGLAFHEVPGLEAVSRAELVQRALEDLRGQSPALLRAYDQLLSSLELVPATFSWHATLGALLEAGMLAFYDPTSRSIVIDRALPLGVRQRVLAHELVHALGDQHHALGLRLDAAANADAAAALLTLAEGEADAVVAELWPPWAPAAEPFQPPAARLQAGVPSVLSRALAASYTDGQTVVRRVLRQGGYAAIDALYLQPPESTHALLDPAFPAVRGVVTPLPALSEPPPGWALRVVDVLGEQAWRTLLEEWLPLEQAAEVAHGWDGDRLALFERGTASVLVWELRSNAEQADAAARVLSARVGNSARSAAPQRANALGCRAVPGGAVMGQRVLGRSLTLVSLHDAVSPVDCAALREWLIPLPRARHPERDPGPTRLIGPT